MTSGVSRWIDLISERGFIFRLFTSGKSNYLASGRNNVVETGALVSKNLGSQESQATDVIYDR